VLYLLSIVESTEPKQVYVIKLVFVSERTIKDHHHGRRRPDSIVVYWKNSVQKWGFDLDFGWVLLAAVGWFWVWGVWAGPGLVWMGCVVFAAALLWGGRLLEACHQSSSEVCHCW
jgi:hypothetical protein